MTGLFKVAFKTYKAQYKTISNSINKDFKSYINNKTINHFYKGNTCLPKSERVFVNNSAGQNPQR